MAGPASTHTHTHTQGVQGLGHFAQIPNNHQTEKIGHRKRNIEKMSDELFCNRSRFSRKDNMEILVSQPEDLWNCESQQFPRCWRFPSSYCSPKELSQHNDTPTLNVLTHPWFKHDSLCLHKTSKWHLLKSQQVSQGGSGGAYLTKVTNKSLVGE